MFCAKKPFYPYSITNKKKILNLPKNLEWILVDDFYYNEEYQIYISSKTAIESKCFKTKKFFKIVKNIFPDESLSETVSKNNDDDSYQIEKEPNVFYEQRQDLKQENEKHIWLPKDGETVWIIGIDGKLIKTTFSLRIHRHLLDYGNVFPTSKEAMEKMMEFIKILKK